MIEFCLEIVFVIFLLIIFQTSYNGLFWKNKSKKRWLWLTLICIITAGVGLLGLKGINDLTAVPYLGLVVIKMDQLFLKVVHYIPVPNVIKWFIYPLIIAWIYFLIKAAIECIKIKGEFNRWASKNVNISKNEKKIKLPNIIKHKDKAPQVPVEFDESVLTKIRYKSALGIQRAFEKSKTRGLQLGKMEEGYIAVYADEAARQKLIKILGGFNIDGSKLISAPAVVTMEGTVISSETVKDKQNIISKEKGGT
jgi:hypothetical protein